ncbi:hypothetical protein [Gabonibacter chumensis]|uniref:hypothetical protein n=1 Tax=Gabonibacter chumensis TaxID=2972474 RepID=UPI0025739BA2|nr:hypothetical protein [Gabonibacter chumensis]MCR9012132.1 hypothetical protein [Gabonibacter chumensis]
MVTIYLDKQVFSHLFNAREEKYALLREKILSHKDEFIFFYSNAHLFDLQDDKTDIKYAEMEFIQTIVDGNRLIYEASKQEVMKQSPHDAFKTIGKVGDFSWLENFDFSQITVEQRNAINNIVDISIKDLKGELEFDWLTKRAPILSNELQVDIPIFKLLINFIAYNFYENKETYKQVRDKTIANYNPKEIKTDGEEIFNEQLVSSPLGLSFIETIKAVLDQTGLSSSDSATAYYMSYMLLDLFGVNKETRKKVKFQNMQADCCHSFFGSYCDCIVSDDEGLRLKSKTLYKLYNFGTKVYSIDEFIEKFEEAINNNQKSAREYFDEIIDDYITRQVSKIETTPEHTLTYLNTSNKYFGYFNCMIERTSSDEAVIILHKNNNLNQPILVKEIEIIVNRIAKVFNDTGASFTLFNEIVELPQLKSDAWNRILMLNDADICLTKFKDAPMLCLWIKLKQPILGTKN